jgi:hypothetical protein
MTDLVEVGGEGETPRTSLDALKSQGELAAAQADAERYRWLREWENEVVTHLICCHIFHEERHKIARCAVNELLGWTAKVAVDPRVSSDAAALIASAEQRRDKLAEALKEILEVWAGAEVGVPYFAQEAYDINFCKQMYSLAVGAMKECGK